PTPFSVRSHPLPDRKPRAENEVGQPRTECRVPRTQFRQFMQAIASARTLWFMSFPISGRELEAAREDVVQALGVHFANDDISIEELDRRLTLAIRATTRAQLTDILADL